MRNEPLIDEKYEREQERDFPVMYDLAEKFLGQFGVEIWTSEGDFWVLDDNWGRKQVKIHFNTMKMLAPPVVHGLRELLKDHPDWEWVVAIAVEDAWPDMGLTIRVNEIIDGLQRQYFPPEYRDVQYVGARVGTDRD